MKLWLLETENGDIQIVRAETELQARELLVAHESPRETAVWWLDMNWATCRELPINGNAEILMDANSNEHGFWGNWNK